MKLINPRQTWLDYFINKGFKAISGAPLVHSAFPTSFNMSAGLVQLDPKIRNPHKIKPVKQVLIQKCVRYFDINRVGDASHLSFFEMPGAFEIVDFKEKQTIQDVWNFLTKKLNINPKKIWITAFEKDKVIDKTISLDNEVKQYLKKLAPNRLVLADKTTNLWQQGGGAQLTDNIKLCGPQVEFFYDFGKNKGCEKTNCSPFCSCGRFLEIANILLIKYYIDYNQQPTLKTLVNPSTEAVIGLERVAQIIEKKANVFKTSYFSPLISIINKGIKLDAKIIADHIKSLTFILGEEKILPGKKDRARIIRTLIRNLLTSCYVLKIKPQKILALLIDEVIKIYADVYPEIKTAKKTVLEIIFNHEQVYLKTLARGKKALAKYLKENKIKKIGNKEKQYFRSKFGIPEKLAGYLGV